MVGRKVKKRTVKQYLEKYHVSFGPVDPSASYRLTMVVAGMGDANTVDITTAAHINTLSAAGLLPSHEVLAHGKPVPAGPIWTGIYIDDFLLLQVILREHARRPAEDSRRASEVSAHYLAKGLPVIWQFMHSAYSAGYAFICQSEGIVPIVEPRIVLTVHTTYVIVRR